MIRTKNVSKTFTVLKKDPGLTGALKALFKREVQIKKALDEVSLHVEGGEIVGLIGSNGAGKTTLVKILAGIIHPDKGEVSVLGYKPWQRKNDFRRQIGLLMGQKAQLWWDLPAIDCFRLLKEIYSVNDSDFNSMLKELTERLSVTSLLQTPVRRLSLGERMKMELIAVLLHRPKVIFLDEPTLGLDITSQKAIRKFLKEYSSDYKPAILITSHYMQDIEELCKRIVIIREGKFIFDGLLSDVRQEFSKTKKISFQLDSNLDEENLKEISFCEGIQKFSQLDGKLSLTVLRSQVSSIVGSMLKLFDVHDVIIEEEDIADIIESLMITKQKA